MTEQDAFSKFADLIRQIVREEVARTTPQPAEARLLTPGELCVALSISQPTLNRWVSQGCPHRRVGSTRRFDLTEVRQWMSARTVAKVVPTNGVRLLSRPRSAS